MNVVLGIVVLLVSFAASCETTTVHAKPAHAPQHKVVSRPSAKPAAPEKTAQGGMSSTLSKTLFAVGSSLVVAGFFSLIVWIRRKLFKKPGKDSTMIPRGDLVPYDGYNGKAGLGKSREIVPPIEQRRTGGKEFEFIGSPTTEGLLLGVPPLDNKFSGQLRPRYTPSPRAELAFLDFVCAVYNRPFTVTMAKEGPREPFHIKSLEGREYRSLLERSGYTVTEVSQGSFDLVAADWAGFQCPYCGAGCAVGDDLNYVQWYCCNILTCYGRAEIIHGGSRKGRCPRCQRWGIIEIKDSLHAHANFSLTNKPAHDGQAKQNLMKPLSGWMK